MTRVLRPLMAVALVAAGCASDHATPAPEPGSVRDYLGYGSVAFLARDFATAATLYASALELEKQRRTLSRDDWRVLVDNLGMAYGISGRLEQARETFEYGLAEDPLYPMFHYNLACTFAELGERDRAIAELDLAFQYQEHRIPGEVMPDPRADSSFTRYLLDGEFNRALGRILAH